MTRNDLLTISQRLREYKDNPHHINPMSESFGRLIIDAADALSEVADDYAAQPSPVPVAASQGEEGRELLAAIEEHRRKLEPMGLPLDDRMTKALEAFAAQPARQVGGDEREKFEARFPLPKGIIWSGDAFRVTSYAGHPMHSTDGAIANRWRGLWEGWQARALLDKAGE